MVPEDKNNFNRTWSLYKLFYIAQSTAFIVPILYIYIQSKFELTPEEILKISSVYSVLSLFLELPCAIIADRFGSKNNLFICLVLQIFSCLSLLVIDSKIAYHIYLICIYTATALCAGASSVLIKKQFICESEEKFNEYIFNLQNSFYKTTSIFILISSFLYTFHYSIPFVLQIINFSVSFYCLMQIPEQYLSIKKSSKGLLKIAKIDLYKSLSFIKGEKYYIYLISCSIIFGLGIDINHKSIQSQIYSLVENYQVIFIGCIIAIGNLFSSIGAKLARKYFLSNFSRSVEILLLGMLLVFSYLLLSIKFLPLAIIGFMFINVFKGCYRPIISSEMINSYPFVSSLNTNLGVVHFICLIVAALLQYTISYSYVDVERGNFVYAIISFIVVALTFLCSRRASEWQIKCQTGMLTEKLGLIEKNEGRLFYLQVYPKYIGLDYLTRIAKIAEAGRYPSKSIVPFIYNEKQVGLRTDYLGDLHLSDIIDPKKQFSICQTLLNEYIHKPYPDIEKIESFSETAILNDGLLELLHTEERLSVKGIIHGDLNPQNILVQNDLPFVIDWDLSTEGPFWYDLLSLLTHPHLYFEKEKRIELFLRHVNHMNINEIESLFFAFCQHKVMRLKGLSSRHGYYHSLSKKYEQHGKEYNHGVGDLKK